MICKHCKNPIREMTAYELRQLYGNLFMANRENLVDYVHSHFPNLCSCEDGQHYAEPETEQ